MLYSYLIEDEQYSFGTLLMFWHHNKPVSLHIYKINCTNVYEIVLFEY